MIGRADFAAQPKSTNGIGKKETFRLILSYGLDCFSQGRHSRLRLEWNSQ